MTWVKSSHSGNLNCVEVNWRTSSHSTADCVQVALGDPVLVRHSKDPDGPVLAFTAQEWLAFLAGARDGEFGHP